MRRSSVARAGMGAAAVLYFWCPAGARTVQGTPSDGEEAKQLDRPVSLGAGPATLAEVLRALSKQIGLTVEPADYLADRELSVHLSGLTARQALDALSELNEWTWRRASPGVYRVGRPRLRLPRDTGQMADALQRVLPPDFRAYLSYGIPEAELQQRYGKDPDVPGGDQIFRPIMPAKLRAATRRAQDRMWEQLAEAVPYGNKVPFTKLTRKQQQSVVGMLVLTALVHLDYGFVDFYPLPPYFTDLSQALVLMPGNQISVESPMVNGTKCGFGGVSVGP